ncbi:SymE family type I addiction module toxin [Stenotrophomonas sp. SrG]|uniref:SymE family type I addiction module toxin n=1 Tax=Stenotrophomonas sp. SrG TaxID=3414430 RepID=UPI003CE8F0A7
MTMYWGETPHIVRRNGRCDPAALEKSASRFSFHLRQAHDAGEPLPCLVLRGSWLRDMGFAVGTKVVIGASEGQINIVLEHRAMPVEPKMRKAPRQRAGVVDARLASLKQRRQEEQS